MNSVSFFSSDSEARAAAARDENAPIYALPILLRYEKSEALDEVNAFRLAAKHMANIMSDERVQDSGTVWGSRWRQWESQQFRKVVRRAKPGQFDRIAGTADDCILTSMVTSEGATLEMLSLLPHPADEPDVRLKNFQVSGLALPHNVPVVREPSSPAMLLTPNYSLGGSTGKMIAQICHAVQLMVYSSTAESLLEWERAGRDVIFSEEFASDKPLNTVSVVDAGFTELPPNSVTVFGAWV